MKERAKFDAWQRTSELGLSTEEVKKKFVDKVKSLNLDSQFDEEFVQKNQQIMRDYVGFSFYCASDQFISIAIGQVLHMPM